MSRLTSRKIFFLSLAAPLVLAGCTSTENAVLEPPPTKTSVVVVPSQTTPAPIVVERNVTTTPPVVVTTPPAVVTTPPAVVATPSTGVTVATPSTTRVVNYPEGRYELRGDASNGYYWVWMPAGVTIVSPPVPPSLARARTTSSPVAVSRIEREIRYAEGRYELQGDSTSGYYWVWIPASYMPPAPPPPAPRIGQNP